MMNKGRRAKRRAERKAQERREQEKLIDGFCAPRRSRGCIGARHEGGQQDGCHGESMVRERTKAKSISGEFATAQSTLFVHEISDASTCVKVGAGGCSSRSASFTIER
jgi:hypothetical protein